MVVRPGEAGGEPDRTVRIRDSGGDFSKQVEVEVRSHPLDPWPYRGWQYSGVTEALPVRSQTSVKLAVVAGERNTERNLPTEEAHALLELVGQLVDREVAPRAADYEARGEFPAEVVRTLGRAGLFGLPYDPEYGGGGQPYVVYLQVLEELAAGWL